MRSGRLCSGEVNFHCSRSETCHHYSLFQELGALPVSVDLRQPPGSVSEEVGGIHSSVQGVKGTEHPQLPRLGSEVSRGPAHIAPQAVPGTVIHQEPDQVRPPWQRAAKPGEKMLYNLYLQDAQGGHTQLVIIPSDTDFTRLTIWFIISGILNRKCWLFSPKLDSFQAKFTTKTTTK